MIRWCSVQQVDSEYWSAKFCLWYCLDVNLVKIYCVHIARDMGGETKCMVRVWVPGSIRIVRSDEFISIAYKYEIVTLNYYFFFLPFFLINIKKTSLFRHFWKKFLASQLQKARFVLDSIAMYQNRVVVYMLAY